MEVVLDLSVMKEATKSFGSVSFLSFLQYEFDKHPQVEEMLKRVCPVTASTELQTGAAKNQVKTWM